MGNPHPEVAGRHIGRIQSLRITRGGKVSPLLQVSPISLDRVDRAVKLQLQICDKIIYQHDAVFLTIANLNNYFDKNNISRNEIYYVGSNICKSVSFACQITP